MSGLTDPIKSIEWIDADIQAALNSPSMSYWLRDALLSALRRDCVDAARDAQILATRLDRRCDAVLRRSGG
ncbi:hypothetical protein BSFA1_85230 (plasmid) [Burkholderia sp. SFA1]|uniref:hypothetical protein n=1 Tax=Burkholderia sp. THE68 TaxID=758782 RepID=UPI0005A0EBE3|nr:hypothetical protein [Burkholderia sp. THE68]BBQ03395.1 hypothetical protein BSFA1_85230 [Burkholderia sp. SFA1]BBU33357.1 hypothetical protein BTHE68_70910 [Burkholderia sp. THE68]